MKKRESRMAKNLNNNKGIALISILIAVAFLTIIGSALLYITYSNFQMKVMNLNSKENFYETDGELVNVTAAVRTYCENPTKADSLVVSDGGGGYVYDITNALTLAGIDTSGTYYVDGDRFELSKTGIATKDVNGSITTYTFKDFAVKQTSDEGYVNKVKTDLKVKILQQTTAGPKKKGLGECSMLFDSTLSCSSNGQFSFLSLYGDTYYSSYTYGSNGNTFGTFPGVAGEGTYTFPGKYTNGSDSAPALLLTNNAKINFNSDYMAVYGDLVLKDKTCLYITTGDLTVYGDIYLLGDSQLVCGGHIYQPSSPLPGRTTQPCVYSAVNTPATAADIKKHVYYPNNTKLAPYIGDEVTDDSFKAFATLLNLNDNDKTNDGISKKIIKEVTYKTQNYGTKTNFNIFKDYASDQEIRVTADYYGTPCGICFLRQDVMNSDYKNYLVFVAHTDSNAKTTRIVQANLGSTFVSNTPLVLDVQHGCYITKMGSDIYDYLTQPTNGTPYYDANIHNFKMNAGGNLESGDMNHYSAKDFLQDDTNTHVSNMFSYGTNGGSGTPTYINSITFEGYVKDAD
ncbi:MAG: hypothetical protein IKI20_09880 [Lachnospiraceae bacterium]|nr:hypothetical protein [Lachnospiraceae bacterium]